MRQLFGLIIFVPLALIIGIFAVENRAQLALEIWPLPGVLEMWASVWILGFLAIGIIVGLAIGWLSGGSSRRRARRAERMNSMLERRLTERDVDPANVAASVHSGSLSAPSGRAAQVVRVED